VCTYLDPKLSTETRTKDESNDRTDRARPVTEALGSLSFSLSLPLATHRAHTQLRVITILIRFRIVRLRFRRCRSNRERLKFEIQDAIRPGADSSVISRATSGDKKRKKEREKKKGEEEGSPLLFFHRFSSSLSVSSSSYNTTIINIMQRHYRASFSRCFFNNSLSDRQLAARLALPRRAARPPPPPSWEVLSRANCFVREIIATR